MRKINIKLSLYMLFCHKQNMKIIWVISLWWNLNFLLFILKYPIAALPTLLSSVHIFQLL